PLSLNPSDTWIGNDGTWSGFVVQVGTPPQKFTVLPATNGQHTYVPSANDCQRTNRTDCGTSRGVSPIAGQPSHGFQTNASSSWDLIGIYELGINKPLGYTGSGVSGYDTLNFGAELSNGRKITDKQVVTSYVSQDVWIGALGLGYAKMTFRSNERVDSMLVGMQQSGIIPSQSFGYTAGAHYKNASASLTLGGYDASRISKGLSIPLSSDDPEKPLTVGLQSVVVENSLNGTQNLLRQPILIPIDSSVTELWLPETVCEIFAAAFGLEYQESSGRYAITEATRNKLRQLNPKLTFTVSDGFVQGQSVNLDFPYSAFDLQAGYPIFPETTNYFPIRRAANESQYVLGRAFLQETYLGVDYERETFNISQATFPDPKEASKIVTITSVNSTTISSGGQTAASNQISGGAIAGIVIGAVAGVALIAALIWFFWARRSKK
ncbi:acid protease, partial [Periconia macrospinosa]